MPGRAIGFADAYALARLNAVALPVLMATLTLPRAQSLGALKPILQEDCFPVFEKGRRCIHRSCTTVLCQFNPGPACYCHSAKRFLGPNEDPETAQPGQWDDGR